MTEPMADRRDVRCPDCYGTGESEYENEGSFSMEPCHLCEGTGCLLRSDAARFPRLMSNAVNLAIRHLAWVVTTNAPLLSFAEDNAWKRVVLTVQALCRSAAPQEVGATVLEVAEDS